MRVPKIGEIKKALAAAAAAAAVAGTAGLITGDVKIYVVGAIATAIAAVATYSAPPNDPAPTPASSSAPPPP